MSSKRTIRTAVATDVPVIVQIDALASGSSAWSYKQLLAVCDGSSLTERALVVEENTKTLGFVVYQIVVDEGSIHTIAVHPGFRRLGLASCLLEAAMKAFAQASVARVFLEVRITNEAARGLYRRAGFEDDGIRKNYYRSELGREDALLMSKFL
ncbi:MAG: ribosomal protein S18-alanine N-acetyltransferase [Halioglobus sp.]